MIKIGSARIDEKGGIMNGRKGDQTGREVMVEDFYVHRHGWNVLRAKNPSIRKKLAEAMTYACNNENIGYSQNDRYDVIAKSVRTDKPTNADCSSLVRACIIDSTGVDVGEFYTGNEKTVLMKSNLFDFIGKYDNDMTLLSGDILVSCKKGHTAIVTDSGETTSDNNIDFNDYYPTYTGSDISIVNILMGWGFDISFTNRKKIAEKNGITGYRGRAKENLRLVELAKQGKLKK